MPGNNEKINTGLVFDAGSMLGNLNNEMNAAIESLQNNINQFGWGWRSPAAEHSKNAFSELKCDMNQSRSNSMQGFSDILTRTVAPGYEETESSNFTLASYYKN